MKIRTLIAVLALTSVPLAGCGDDDSQAASAEEPQPVTIGDWVEEFDRLCVETGEELSDPSLSDEESEQISVAAIEDMRAIGEPSTSAAEATTLLDVIETQSTDPDLTQEEIDEMDARFLDAATVLDISDECIGGAQG